MKKSMILILLLCGFMVMIGCGNKKKSAEIIQPRGTYEVSDNSAVVSENSVLAKENTTISENDEKPDYYNTYAKLLFQFMTDPSCGYSANLEAMTYSPGFSFMLKDLNKDGREELIVGSGYECNLLVPADTWQEANLGPFTNYDETTSIFEWEHGDLGGGQEYYVLKDDKLEIVDQYEYEVFDGEESWNGEKYYHIDKDGTKNEISEEEYNKQTSKGWKQPEGNWIKLTPSSLELLTDVKVEELVDINMSSPITVMNYDQRNNTDTQVEYNSVSEFITSNGFEEGKPFHKYRSISEKTQMLLFYNENTEIGCVVLVKDSVLEGYSFVGVSKDKNDYGLEKLVNLKHEYANPFDVSERMDIYSTEFVGNLQEDKKSDENGNIISYSAKGMVADSTAGYEETVVSVECVYDQNNVLRHRAFNAHAYLYGTSETPKNTCYDFKGRVEYVDYYMTSGKVYDYYIYSTEDDSPKYNLDIDFGRASLNVY